MKLQLKLESIELQITKVSLQYYNLFKNQNNLI